MPDRTTDKGTDSVKDAQKVGFGEHLRREREMRGISLDEICSATRIGTRFLQALENEQWNQLPGGIFNRGFVRAVGHHLGLNEENLLAEYTLATGDHATVTTTVRMPPFPERDLQWIVWLFVLIVIAGIALGSIYGWRRYAAHKKATHPPASLELRGPIYSRTSQLHSDAAELFRQS